MDNPSAPKHDRDVSTLSSDRIYLKITWRIMPLILVCYVMNQIDRTNVGMAQLHLQRDLGFSAAVYGIGVGVFYLGYVLFEIPSNLLLEKLGVRKTLLRIMLAWGVLSTCTMFVRTPSEFYIVRFALGLAEAGFYPGVLLYITYWFPSGHRARITALFMVGGPLAGLIGSPLSGIIMDVFEGFHGLYGWQWMFLIEGLPAVFLGIFAFFYLQDRPEDARWLSTEEKAVMDKDFAAERVLKARGTEYGHGQMLRDPRVYLLGLVALGSYTLASASGFWTPLLLQASGVKSASSIGILGAIPHFVTMIAMQFYARHSDRTRERRWHFSGAQFVGAAALILLALFGTNTYVVILGNTLTMAATYCAGTVFSNIAAVYLSERTRASGLALMTSMGALASATAPIAMGWLRAQTGSFSTGLVASAMVVIAGATLLLFAIPASSLREAR